MFAPTATASIGKRQTVHAYTPLQPRHGGIAGPHGNKCVNRRGIEKNVYFVRAKRLGNEVAYLV
ncbi:MAG: hypothetical protein ABIO92_05215 [Chloroflexia bacterium]